MMFSIALGGHHLQELDPGRVGWGQASCRKIWTDAGERDARLRDLRGKPHPPQCPGALEFFDGPYPNATKLDVDPFEGA